MLTSNVTFHNKKILITGSAGFIGANLIQALIKMDIPCPS